MAEYNIYCDESCHLKHSEYNSENRYMVIGGISVTDASKKQTFNDLKTIKKEHSIGKYAEMKWTKVSNNKIDAYKKFIDYFFDNENLRFRAVLVDKTELDYKKHIHSHDEFYYKMYYYVLDRVLDQNNQYNIYLDIKDTRSENKVSKLKDVLEKSNHDFDKSIIKKCQQIQSSEVILMELNDIIIGAISYINRYDGNGNSNVKNELANYIKAKSGLSLMKSTTLGASKFNIFRWKSGQ